MAEDPPSFYAYKEVRVSSDPVDAASVRSIRLPNPHGSSRPLSRRKSSRDGSRTIDENSFARAHLATSAAIYFRHSKKHPRSFLWRVLEEGTVLGLQCIDLNKSSATASDASQVLRLIFPSPIRPAGIAFADSDKHNCLYVFALTAANDLYTLTLPAHFFSQQSSADEHIDTWCKTFQPSSFSFRYPHRLVARNEAELLVSLHDGGLLRLTREADSNGEGFRPTLRRLELTITGSSWVETSFNEGGWGSSLRGLIPWQGNHTVRFGNANLEQTTATALTFAPAPLHAGGAPEHVYTICLNHTLKAWNLQTGKIGFTRDLLNQARTPQDLGRYLIDPTRTSLTAVIDQRLRGDRDRHYLITFSPIGSGEFKFWAVADPDREEGGIEDLYPGEVFEPPPPSSEIWTVAEFQVAPGGQPGSFVLWILWKNNTHSRVQSLTFDLLNLADDWARTWTATSPETLMSEPLPVVSASDSSDATAEWLDYLFHPGRFSEAVLDTSLSIYQQNLNVPTDQQRKKGTSLRERICTSVGCTTSLAPDADGGMDYHRYRIDVDFQWRRFYRIVVELNKQRGEALSLAYDGYTDLAWVVAASGVAAIRDCHATEIMWHNKLGMITDDEAFRSYCPNLPSSTPSTDDLVSMAGLVKAAAAFRDCFSDNLLQLCHTVLDAECFQEVSASAPARIQNFYDRCNFIAHITDEDLVQLRSALDEDAVVGRIDTDLFQAVISLLSYGKPPSTCETAMTTFGRNIVVRGVQETIYLNSNILFDLLMLLIFIAVDESFGPEEASSEDDETESGHYREIRQAIRPPEIFLDLLKLVKAYKVLGWFTETEEPVRTPHTAPNPAAGGNPLDASSQPHRLPARKIPTLLQVSSLRKWRPRWTQPRHPMSSLITSSFGALIGSLQLQHPESYRSQILKAQLYYCARDNLPLATQTLRFQSNTAWSTYIKARICLSSSQHTQAGLHFKRAGYQLANGEGLIPSHMQDPEYPSTLR